MTTTSTEFGQCTRCAYTVRVQFPTRRFSSLFAFQNEYRSFVGRDNNMSRHLSRIVYNGWRSAPLPPSPSTAIRSSNPCVILRSRPAQKICHSNKIRAERKGSIQFLFWNMLSNFNRKECRKPWVLFFRTRLTQLNSFFNRFYYTEFAKW